MHAIYNCPQKGARLESAFNQFDCKFDARKQVDNRSDFFTSLGAPKLTSFSRSRRSFVEVSLAIGHFDEGGHAVDRNNGTRLRSSLGGGVYLTDRKRVSVTLDHILDMDFKNDHPGSESLHLRYTWEF